MQACLPGVDEGLLRHRTRTARACGSERIVSAPRGGMLALIATAIAIAIVLTAPPAWAWCFLRTRPSDGDMAGGCGQSGAPLLWSPSQLCVGVSVHTAGSMFSEISLDDLRR